MGGAAPAARRRVVRAACAVVTGSTGSRCSATGADLGAAPGAGRSRSEDDRWLLRLEWGWGERGAAYAWNGALRLGGGEIVDVEPAFRGNDMLDPRDDDAGMSEDDVPHEILEAGPNGCGGAPRPMATRIRAWPPPARSSSRSPPAATRVSTWTSTACKRELPPRRSSARFPTAVDQAVVGAGPSRAPSRRGRRARAHAQLDDEGPAGEADWYLLRVGQANGQWAWSSPIWVPP